MSFLDNFTGDMRTLTRRANTKAKNAIGETVTTATATSQFLGVFLPIGVIGNDQRYINNAILMRESTHILYYAKTQTLTIKDEIVDESGNIYTIKQIEEVPDFGGGIDHMTAFLVLKR